MTYSSYTSYPRKIVSIEDLYLDAQNVRIPESIQNKDKQSVLASYLLKYENVDSLIDSFIKEGYTDIEQPVVLERDDGSYLVLEGNRRVTALKVLLHPDLVPTEQPKILAKLEKAGIQKWDISKINVQIANSRETFDVQLARLHTQKPKKAWPRDQIAQFYYSKIIEDESLSLKDLKSRFPEQANNIDKFVHIRSLRESIMSADFEKLGYPDLASKLSNYFPYTPFEYAMNKATSIINIQFDTQRGLVKNLTNQQLRALLLIAEMVSEKNIHNA